MSPPGCVEDKPPEQIRAWGCLGRDKTQGRDAHWYWGSLIAPAVGVFLVPTISDLMWLPSEAPRRRTSAHLSGSPVIQPWAASATSSKHLALLASGLHASSSVWDTYSFPCLIPTPSSGLSLKAPGSGKPHFTPVGERLLPWAPKRPSVSPIIPHLRYCLFICISFLFHC